MNIWEKEQYKEIWIYAEETEDDDRAMLALLNGDYGWLMYLNEEGDAGLSSRNTEYAGTDDDGKTMDFMMSNGQMDRYPLSYVLPAEQVMKALDYFKKYHQLPPFIMWQE